MQVHPCVDCTHPVVLTGGLELEPDMGQDFWGTRGAATLTEELEQEPGVGQ